MTEIVKNSNNMTFDLLETGNGSANQPEATGIFNDLFGGLDTEENTELKNTNISDEESDYAEMDIRAIINMLNLSNLNLPEDILEEIKIRLKKLFEQINMDGVSSNSINSTEINKLGNENFVHIMKFLEELESLIKLNESGKDRNSQLDSILDRIRTKLNEQVKASITRKITSQKTTKIDPKIVSQEQRADKVKIN